MDGRQIERRRAYSKAIGFRGAGPWGTSQIVSVCWRSPRYTRSSFCVKTTRFQDLRADTIYRACRTAAFAVRTRNGRQHNSSTDCILRLVGVSCQPFGNQHWESKEKEQSNYVSKQTKAPSCEAKPDLISLLSDHRRPDLIKSSERSQARYLHVLGSHVLDTCG